MPVLGLNLVFARGAGKYTRIVYLKVRVTWIFCTGVALSLLDFLERPTSLKEELAAPSAAMVESSDWVIDLRAHA